jgi:hypothetical protein
MPARAHVVESIKATGTPEPLVEDVADWLPQHGQAVLRRLRQELSEAKAITRSLADDAELQRGALARAQQHMRRLRAPAAEQGFALSEDHPTVQSEQKKLDAMRAELARMSSALAQRDQKRQQIGRLVERAEQFIRERAMALFSTALHRNDRVLPAARPVAPKLLKGENLDAALARVRARATELTAELGSIEHAPLPIQQLRKRMRANVGAMAAIGKPGIAADGSITWPTTRLESQVFTLVPVLAQLKKEEPKDEPPARYPWARPVEERIKRHEASDRQAISAMSDGFAAAEVFDSVSVLCWLFEREIIAKLEAQIGTREAGNALSEQERLSKRGRIASELLNAEREEVALVEQACEQGNVIGHREDVVVRALLAVE